MSDKYKNHFLIKYKLVLENNITQNIFQTLSEESIRDIIKSVGWRLNFQKSYRAELEKPNPFSECSQTQTVDSPNVRSDSMSSAFEEDFVVSPVGGLVPLNNCGQSGLSGILIPIDGPNAGSLSIPLIGEIKKFVLQFL